MLINQITADLSKNFTQNTLDDFQICVSWLDFPPERILMSGFNVTGHESCGHIGGDPGIVSSGV